MRKKWCWWQRPDPCYSHNMVEVKVLRILKQADRKAKHVIPVELRSLMTTELLPGSELVMQRVKLCQDCCRTVELGVLTVPPQARTVMRSGDETMLVDRVHDAETGSACRIAAVHQVAEIDYVAASCLNNREGKEMDSRT